MEPRIKLNCNIYTTSVFPSKSLYQKGLHHSTDFIVWKNKLLFAKKAARKHRVFYIIYVNSKKQSKK